jgi:hypothetical protein
MWRNLPAHSGCPGETAPMRRLSAALLVPLLLLAAAPAAVAVGRFGAPHQVGPSSCLRLVSAKAPDGSTRGYLSCRSGVRYVEGSGSSWRTSTASQMPLAVAVGSSLFALVQDKQGLFVARGGSSGALTMVQRLSAASQISGATIVASGDKWWALWGVPDGDRATFNLWEAHTLAGSVKPRRIFDSDAYPSITYQPSTGRAVAVWSHGGSASTTVMSSSRGGSWTKPRVVDASGGLGVVAVSGKTVAVVTKHAFGVATHVGTVDGPLSTHVMALRFAGGGLALDMSTGRLLVAYRGLDASNAKVLQVAERVGSRWSETTLSRDRLEELADVQSVNGQGRLFSHVVGGGIRVRTQAAAVSLRPLASRAASPRATALATASVTASATATTHPSAAVTPASPAAVESTSPPPVQVAGEPASDSGSSTGLLAGVAAVLLVGAGLVLVLVRRRRS